MLTPEQLRALYPAPIVQHHGRNILAEYIQHELLDSLFKQDASAYLSFTGGTCIRIMYGSHRFSEDLDFDNFGLSFSEFQDLLEATLADIRAKGFEADYRFVEKGAYHCYVRFPRVLQAHALSALPGEKVLVRVDTMQKEQLRAPTLVTLNAFDIYRQIAVNPPDVVLAQKMIAIRERKREKGRDFYDVSFLYGRTEPNVRYLEALLHESFSDFTQALLLRCRTLDYAKLARDVEPFLMNKDDTKRIETFLPFIEQKLKAV